MTTATLVHHFFQLLLRKRPLQHRAPAARRLTIVLLTLAPALAFATPCWANHRMFTYTYETAVLPQDARELELWTTWRGGRDRYYSAFDHRLEFEIGLTDQLMTAFYLNFGAVTAETPFGLRETSFDYQGVSSEWKYKLTDPFADPVGLGLYAEFSAGTREYEIELKMLADKRIGPLLLAANLVGEVEWEVEGEETRRELIFAPHVAATWLVLPNLGVGLEFRNHNEIVGSEWEHSAIHMGPVVSYGGNRWWAALTAMAQLAAPKGAHGGSLILDEHEKLEVRLMLGMDL